MVSIEMDDEDGYNAGICMEWLAGLGLSDDLLDYGYFKEEPEYEIHTYRCQTCPYKHRCETGAYLITEARDMAIYAKAEHLYYMKAHINHKYQEYWDWKMWNYGYSTEADCFINSADYKRFMGDDINEQDINMRF